MFHAYTGNARDVYTRADIEEMRLAVSYSWVIGSWGSLWHSQLLSLFEIFHIRSLKVSRKSSSLYLFISFFHLSFSMSL